MSDIERKLASVEAILEVKDIPDADFIQAYKVKGWWVVDAKGKYTAGDLVVYCEIDSWIPTSVAPFLSKGKEPKMYDGISGERLRTAKLKKQLSQGLLLSIEHCIETSGCTSPLVEGFDCTEWLGITKWEAPVPAQLAGQARGLLPSGVIKTDQPRVQNISNYLDDYYGLQFEITEKLHGSSCTFFLDNENEFHVCSRNLDLKYDENNSFWKAAIKYGIEAKMKSLHLNNVAIQGELIGEGICGNQYKVILDFYVFDILNTACGTYYSSYARKNVVDNLGLNHVPIVCYEVLNDKYTCESILDTAEGLSKLNGSTREGLVWKCIENPSFSFKAISDKWLLKND